MALVVRLDFPKKNNTMINDLFATVMSSTSHHLHLPSFFEIWLVDSINESIKPAIRHFLMALCEQLSPRWIPFFLFDQKTFIMLLDLYSIRNYHATIAESLYGMRRVSVDVDNNQTAQLSRNTLARENIAPLSQRQRDLSIALVVRVLVNSDSCN